MSMQRPLPRSKTLFFELAQAAGYCCINSLLRGNAKVRTGLLSARLGVERSTVIKWRRALNQGQINVCSLCPQQVSQHKPLQCFDADARNVSAAPSPSLSSSAIPRKLLRIL
jgi:hypothetical protein